MNKFTQRNIQSKCRINSKIFGSYQPSVYIISRSKSRSSSNGNEKCDLHNSIAKLTHRLQTHHPNHYPLQSPFQQQKLTQAAKQLIFGEQSKDLPNLPNLPKISSKNSALESEDSAIERIFKWMLLRKKKLQQQAIEQQLSPQKEYNPQKSFTDFVYRLFVFSQERPKTYINQTVNNLAIEKQTEEILLPSTHQNYRTSDVKEHAIDQVKVQDYLQYNSKRTYFNGLINEDFGFQENKITDFRAEKQGQKNTKLTKNSMSKQSKKCEAKSHFINVSTAESLENKQKDILTKRENQFQTSVQSNLLAQSQQNVLVNEQSLEKLELSPSNSISVNHKFNCSASNSRNPSPILLNESRGLSIHLNSSRGISLGTNSLQSADRKRLMNQSLDSDFSLVKIGIAGFPRFDTKSGIDQKIDLCDQSYFPYTVFYREYVPEKLENTQQDSFLSAGGQNQNSYSEQMSPESLNSVTLSIRQAIKGKNDSSLQWPQKPHNQKKHKTPVQEYFNQNLEVVHSVNEMKIDTDPSKASFSNMNSSSNGNQRLQVIRPDNLQREQSSSTVFTFESLNKIPLDRRQVTSLSNYSPQNQAHVSHQIRKPQLSNNAFVQQIASDSAQKGGQEQKTSVSHSRNNRFMSSQNTTAIDRDRLSSYTSNQSQKSSKPKIIFHYQSPPKDENDRFISQCEHQRRNFGSSKGIKDLGSRPVRIGSFSPNRQSLEEGRLNAELTQEYYTPNPYMSTPTQSVFRSMPSYLHQNNMEKYSSHPQLNNYSSEQIQQNYGIQHSNSTQNRASKVYFKKFAGGDLGAFQKQQNIQTSKERYENPKSKAQKPTNKNSHKAPTNRKKIRSLNEKILVTVARARSPFF